MSDSPFKIHRFQINLLVVLVSILIGLTALFIDIILDFFVLNETNFIEYLEFEITSNQFVTRRFWIFLFPFMGVVIHNLILSKKMGIKQREAQILDFINNSNDVIITYSSNKIIHANPFFWNRIGFQKQDVKTLKIEQFFPKFQDCEEKGSGEYIWISKNGNHLDMEVLISSIPYKHQKLIIAKDMTEKKRMQEALDQTKEQLLRSQKMEIVGRFINTVIHDFNNLLQIIYGHIQLIEFRPDATSIEDLQPIKQAVKKSEGLIEQLLVFSKSNKDLTKEILNINEVISETKELINKLIRGNITLKLDLDEKLHKIRANRSQIDQIILNLIINAKEAMPEGGKLLIQTKQQQIPDNGKQKEYCVVSITDSGIGMTQETREKLFEPFYTTKDHGNGMGLFTVYSIVKQNGGEISVKSELGMGTTIRMYFPCNLPQN